MNVSTVIGAILIVVVGSFVWWQNGADEVVSTTPPTVENSAPAPSVIGTNAVVDDNGGERKDSESDDTNAGSETAANPPPAPSGMTAALVAQHGTRASCWSIVNGNVYDLTSWIPKHPGGEQAILQICGTDGSLKFNRQHGGDSAKEKMLFGFKIGALAQ